MHRPGSNNHPLTDLRTGVLGKGGCGKSTLVVLDGRALEPEIDQIVNWLEARLATDSPSGMARPNRLVEES